MTKRRIVPTLILALMLAPTSAAVSREGSEEVQRDRERAAEALKEKNPQRAAKLLEPWFKKVPNDIELSNQYAQALAQMGRLDQAREVLESALMKNPDTAVAFENLREILSQQAAISYAKALGKKPPGPQLVLKGGEVGAKAPTVAVAQVEPRKVAPAVELPPAQTPPVVNAKPESAVAKKSEESSAKPAPAAPEAPSTAKTDKASGEKSDKTGAARAVAGSEEVELAAALRAWAKAWSDKDFNRYLDSYSSRFQPQQFASRDAWVAHRKPRVTRPDPILVQVSDIKIKPISTDQVEIRFRQRYEAGSTKLNSVKTSVWVKESGVWKILREEGR